MYFENCHQTVIISVSISFNLRLTFIDVPNLCILQICCSVLALSLRSSPAQHSSALQREKKIEEKLLKQKGWKETRF